jgi:ferredoxin
MTNNTELGPVTSHKIDLSLCTGCELCITIGPAAILAQNEEKGIFFQADKVELCIRCGHCMAMCETAHSLGLGATAIGLIGPAINQSKPLRQLFRIPEGNEVVESMIAGYPKFPFKRAIVRPRTKVTFIS